MSRGTIVITGACGLLGAHLMAYVSRAHEVVGMDRHPWWGDQPMTVLEGDVQDRRWVADVLGSVQPRILFHCAALVDVDACEAQPERAFAAHADATKALVQAAGPQCVCVYISTDSIFGGETPGATETDVPHPVNVYGRSKLQGEREVEQHAPEHLIIRTNFYGWSSGRKKTFAEWLYSALERGEPVTLFADRYFSPIYVVDLVERLWRLVAGGHRGRVHVAGGERVSKHQFGSLLAEAAGFSLEHVRAGALDEAGLRAPRPRDMSLNSNRFQHITGTTVPGCLEGLRRFHQDRHVSLSRRFTMEALPHVTIA